MAPNLDLRERSRADHDQRSAFCFTAAMGCKLRRPPGSHAEISFPFADRFRVPISHCLVMTTNIYKTTRALCLLLALAATSLHLRAATITVTNTADDGSGTLRTALASAANGDTIDFSLTTALVISPNG